MDNYTKEQQANITERLAKAEVALKELHLYPAAVVQKVNKGNDEFVDKVICYLQDNLYTPTLSPINKNDISKA